MVTESGQQRAVAAIQPSARARVHRIGRIGKFDVPDPCRERSLELIERGLDETQEVFWSKQR